MESTSPPLTPTRRVSPLDTLSHARREDIHLHRRSSSFSSNHDRSPVTPRAQHRYSITSQGSHDFGYSADDGGGGGGGGMSMGNLADELDQLDEDYDYDDEVGEGGQSRVEGGEDESGVDGSRDSGIDVSYTSKRSTPGHVRNFSKPLGKEDKPPDEESEDAEERFTPELDDLVNTIARMTAYTSTTEDPLIPRTTALLQDLGNQTSLEAGVQRFSTSTNSMTAYATAQTKTMQILSQSLYPIFAFSAPLDSTLIEETIPLVDALLHDLPQPDPVPSQKLQRLTRETSDVISALSQLTDTLQMGKQITTTAARHLRTTQTMVSELLRERERAEDARRELASSDVWGEKAQKRACGAECREIVSGFESTCDSLRASIAELAPAAASAGA